jgi:UDP-N-acetylglucosamine 2-epimerase
MIKIVSIVGARPQFIKAAPVCRVLRGTMTEVLVHTGQHYDENMSRIFFDDLGLPRPDYDLEVGSGSHAVQTGLMMERIERVLIDEKPDLVLVYGDTNSTLAGALAAAKLCVPIGHVEAGLRSYNRRMPEEVNRLLVDHCSDLLFCPTDTARKNLEKEGITEHVFLTGDVMYDVALEFGKLADQRSRILTELGIDKMDYVLCTVHRAHSTDHRDHLSGIVDALIKTGDKVVFPVHPRTRVALERFDLIKRMEASENIVITQPVSYLDMIQLEKNAKKILTDSGGVQKEAYFYRVPCITLRDETEWVETIEDGWNVLVGTKTPRILQAIQTFLPASDQRTLFGNGKAAVVIGEIITDYVSKHY